MTNIGFVGDPHGNWHAVNDLMENNPEVDEWICVGDLLTYRSPKKQMYFIKGNHEDFEVLDKIKDGTVTIPNLTFVPNGEMRTVNGMSVFFYGGNYSPKAFEKPIPKNEHKYHRKKELDSMPAHADIVVTHEAPESSGHIHGLPHLDQIGRKLRPHLWVFGHHHVFYGNYHKRYHTQFYCVPINGGIVLHFTTGTVNVEKMVTHTKDIK